MGSIDISMDNDGIFEAVTVENRLNQELRGDIASRLTSEYIASMVIGEDSSHLDNPDGGVVEDDTNSVDSLGSEAAARLRHPNMSHLKREESVYPDPFLSFDPSGYSSEFMNYGYPGDMGGDGELEALNLQTRDEGLISNSQEQPGETLEPIPEPMEIDADLVREVMMNASESGQAAIGTIDPALLLIPAQEPPA